MTAQHLAKVQAGNIPCLDPHQATNLKKLGHFYSDTEQTLAGRQAIVNFIFGHESGHKASFFFLIGASGLGKTGIITKVLGEDLPGVDGWREDQVLQIELLKPKEKKEAYSLAVAMLDALNDPLVSKKIGEDKLTRRAINLLKHRQYRLVVLDDFQNLFSFKTRDEINSVVSLIKKIVDGLKIPMVVVGHPEVEHIIMAKDEVKGRTVRVFHMKPFNASDRESLMDLRAFLEELDLHLPGQDVGLSNEGVARKICYLTGGRPSFIWRLIWNALERAQSRGDALRTRDIGEAFEELRTSDEEEMDNVFL